MRLTSLIFLSSGAAALSLVGHPSPALMHSVQPTAAVTRGAVGTGALRCSTAPPEPTKNRPKKLKRKEPKQKVKGPQAAAGLIAPEQTFWEGPPSKTETIIPAASVLTVVGIIPFTASLARQAWTRYKLTNRRLEVASGFQGKDLVQVTWKEITDIRWLRRYGGAAGDIVFDLKDGSKLEMRSLDDFERNLNFIMEQLQPGVQEDAGYPDAPAKSYLAKVAAGELPKPELPPLDGAVADEAADVASE